MLTALCNTVVQKHATMTRTALTKNAAQTTINVDWIRTALIGQSAVRSLNAGMARVTAIMIGNVKACLCVAMISVEMDHQQWTVVKVSLTHSMHCCAGDAMQGGFGSGSDRVI